MNLPEGTLGSGYVTRSMSLVVLVFVTTRMLPFLVYFMIMNWVSDSNIATVLFLVGITTEFVIVKNRFGWDMIGFAWTVAPQVDGTIVQFTTKPPPFVPTFALANTFWVGFFVAGILWMVAFFVSLVKGMWLLVAFALAGIVTEGINMAMFMRGQAAAQREAATIARTGMLDNSIKFAMAEDDDEDEASREDDV